MRVTYHGYPVMSDEEAASEIGKLREAIRQHPEWTRGFLQGVRRAADCLNARADEIEAEGGSIFAGATVTELRQQAKRLRDMAKKEGSDE